MGKVLNLSSLMTTPTIVESICQWNAARYDQIVSVELTAKLLREELKELVDAKKDEDIVETCDAYADIFFVAIGAIWKHGMTHQDISAMMDRCEELYPLPVAINAGISWYEEDQCPEILALVALRAITELELFLNSSDAAIDIIRAVCISNNTKVANKTAADVKANVDKGDTYVAPTKHLTNILDMLKMGAYKTIN